MVKSIYENPHAFRFESVEIKTDRTTKTIDAFRITSELTIYEHIDKPFITGRIVFVDIDPTFALVDKVHFLGTEKIKVKIRTNESEKFTITKNFIVTEVISSIKNPDGQEVITLDMIEDVAYHSSLMRVSKSFKGTKDEIIKKLIEGVERELLIKRNADITGDKLTKLIVPNMHPLEAANWIKDRTYTSDGFPYFLYSTIADDKLRLLDLKTILNEKAMNRDTLDYTYSMAFAQQSKEFTSGVRNDIFKPIDIHREAFTITSVSQRNVESHLQLARMGMTSSQYNFIDTTTGNNIKVEHNMSKKYLSMIENQVLRAEADTFYPVYDHNFRIGKKLEEFDKFSTREITHFATSRQFNDFADTESYQEGKTVSDHEQKVQAKSLRHWLLKSALTIQLPGKNFLMKEKNMTIGNIIRCRFLANVEPAKNMTEKQITDLKKSGEYMIYSARHQFTNQQYHVTMDMGRLGTKGYGIH